jgi:ATP-dependent Lon protease
MRTNIFPFHKNILNQGEITEVQLCHLTPTQLEKILDPKEENILYPAEAYEPVLRGDFINSEYKKFDMDVNDSEYFNINLLHLTGERYLVGHYFKCISITEVEDGHLMTASIHQRAIVRDPVMEDTFAHGVSYEFPMAINMNEKSRKEKVNTIIMYLVEINKMQLEYVYDEDTLGNWVPKDHGFKFMTSKNTITEHEGLMQQIKEMVVELPVDSESVRRMMDSSTEKEYVSELTRYLRLWNNDKKNLYKSINEKYRVLLSYDKQNNDLNNLRKNLEAQLLFVNQELSASGHIRDDLLSVKSSDKKDGYADRIRASEIPEPIKEAALEEVDRLSQTHKDNTDHYKLCIYLDFILALPWKKEPEKKFDISKAEKLLNKNHYGMEKVKERILQQLAAQQFKKDKKGTVLLLVGPPGVGKTSIAQSIAKALDREYVRLSLGGVSREENLRGFQRTYTGSKAGRILDSMKSAGTTNPVFVLDEVDKLGGGGHSGDPHAALLEILDPAQNHGFVDHYLNLPYDLSDVFFVATANDLSDIPAPLRDRMEVIEVSSYTSEEKFHIAKDYIYSRTLDEYGLSSKHLRITGDAMKSMINDYTCEAGVRDLQRKFTQICLTTSKKVLVGKEPLPIRVKPSNLEEFLGDKVGRNDTIQSSNPPGVVNGLVASLAGGGVSLVETIKMPGTGQVVLTGQLGEVIQESAKLSQNLLRSRLPLKAIKFQELDLHIHFPQGAIPKDGPSAGITVFTALASLFTGKQVDSSIAMTGELTLSGRVLPVGGVKEKLLGASRAGVKKVLIPEANRMDLNQIPQEVKNQLDIITVSTVDEVLQETLGITIAPPKVMEIQQNFGQLNLAG